VLGASPVLTGGGGSRRSSGSWLTDDPVVGVLDADTGGKNVALRRGGEVGVGTGKDVRVG
jgi:hypothetical protein